MGQQTGIKPFPYHSNRLLNETTENAFYNIKPEEISENWDTRIVTNIVLIRDLSLNARLQLRHVFNALTLILNLNAGDIAQG